MSILPFCPSLPFCLSQKFSLPEEGKHRKEERDTSYLPQLAARHISGAAAQHGVSRTVLSVQGDEVTWEMCYSLRTREWSMPDRHYAEGSSHFRCQTQYLFTGSDVSPNNPVSENHNPLRLSRLGIQKVRLVWLPGHWEISFSVLAGFGLARGHGKLGRIPSGVLTGCPFL